MMIASKCQLLASLRPIYFAIKFSIICEPRLKRANTITQCATAAHYSTQAGTLVISSLNVAADRSSRNVTSLNHLDLQKVLVDLNCVYLSRLRHQLPVQKSGLTAALYSTNVINVWQYLYLRNFVRFLCLRQKPFSLQQP